MNKENLVDIYLYIHEPQKNIPNTQTDSALYNSSKSTTTTPSPPTSFIGKGNKNDRNNRKNSVQ